MDDATAQLLRVTLPGDDGIIAEALAGLKRKISEYHEALRACHRHLAEGGPCFPDAVEAGISVTPPGVEKTAPADIPDRVGGTAGTRVEPPATSAGGSEPRADDPACRLQSDSAGRPGDDQVRSVSGPGEAQATGGAAAPAEPAEATKRTKSPGIRVYEPAASAAARTPSPRVDEDEALLASLDPETAEAIRVMRRLSPVRRSVRDLLEEHRAAMARQAETRVEKKRSWFSRGK